MGLSRCQRNLVDPALQVAQHGCFVGVAPEAIQALLQQISLHHPPVEREQFIELSFLVGVQMNPAGQQQPVLSLNQLPGSALGTTPPPPSCETRNRADPAPLAHTCHRPRPASARSPSTPASGSHACAAPIASAPAPPTSARTSVRAR